MGCRARVLVVGGSDRLAAGGRERLARLEARWSRFLPDSELSRLHGHSGVPVVVSPDTYTLVERAVAGWEATGGRYDPTVLDALVVAGYDRTFDLVAAVPASPGPARPAPGCAGIVLDPTVRAVTLPPGVHIDPGGIGKGLAADLVVEELRAQGAAGALVEVGGDLRVWGEPPEGDAWTIAIEDPFGARPELARVAVADGAVVTTSVRWRTWRAAGRRLHHLIDPATGAPAASGLVAVTIVSGDAWWGEVLAKAAFVSGLAEGVQVIARSGMTGILVTDGGEAVAAPGFEEVQV